MLVSMTISSAIARLFRGNEVFIVFENGFVREISESVR